MKQECLGRYFEAIHSNLNVRESAELKPKPNRLVNLQSDYKNL